MTPKPGKASLGNRLAMWRARRSPPALGFVSTPEPRSIGLYSKGRQLVAGNFLFAGTPVSYTHLDVYKRQRLYFDFL